MGPLSGIRILEIAGIGPGPFAAMLLADMGADVIRIDRPETPMFANQTELDFLNRGKRSICIDLKKEGAVALVEKLVARADGFLEGFRPGVLEKYGLGPDDCLALNQKLVYGRMTGWGQEGPMANRAGHDINYIALAGALEPMGRAGEKPAIPLNLVGDFGGGGMLLAFGMVCALLEAKTSGKGQVVDAAMVDGASLLMTSLFSAYQTGYWGERGTNMIDGGAPFYEVYETSDGKYLAVGALESQFYQVLVERLGLADSLPNQYDMEQWPAMKERFAEVFATRTRDEWAELFADCDACVTPVLAAGELKDHPHHRARNSIVQRNGVWQPRTAPRFSRTDGGEPGDAVAVGANSGEVLTELGYSEQDQRELIANGVVSTAG
ncbi:alpha-methylacyl-CoA racemase [Litorivivens lipolytica]|uniref:Alpha-methylacyl-CoA racemase n=1 Tax=Litorivivens lipolytica TaxID=1524264 RepID=A0A7W4W2J2_9GAMM|nr:CaiB/BaiF CoA-transferase family protein [Litorivivens lipolytica]MBB3046236.1 alpha-methylacyl-CoA racemase [Litorivivens lipolytica]